ncbi:MAG: Rrf2 family transcriptional regulator [Firmicutes bacterium]|nr:Rrf2 family transcriptional regulator [Bacillota bacterium]
MKVSKRTEYGLRAVVRLAEHGGQHAPVPLREIAALEDIPEAFLDQIFGALRRIGVVSSVRGAGGGYQLAHAPEEISMGEIVRTLEGGMSPIGCVGDDGVLPADFCSRATHCHTRSVWVRLNSSIEQALNSITLADVLVEQLPEQAL